MATVNLSPVINGVNVLGTTGLPLSGGLIYTYQAGSSTALPTYTDNSGNVANANPIVLNPDGRAPNEIWLNSGYSYKFQIQTALGVVVQTLDNIYGIPQSSSGGGSNLPSGCIVIWSGAIGSVPSGYTLCDGTNGTPDLRNSFVLGAGNSYTVGQTGGSNDAIVVSHTHTATVTDPGHTHVQRAYPSVSTSGNTGIPEGGNTSFTAENTTPSTASAVTGISVANSTTGTSGTNANLPPYYALAFIMKT